MPGFGDAMALELRFEGGYVNDPRDHGGITNQGITQRAVVNVDWDGDGLLDFDFDGDGQVDESDMREIPQHPAARDEFYRRGYWIESHADRLWWPLSLYAFDGAIQHGPGTSKQQIQKALGVKPDGDFGPLTMAAVMQRDRERVQLDYFVLRHTLYARICWRRAESVLRGQPLLTADTLNAAYEYGYCYLTGWTRRVEALQQYGQA